MKIHLLLIAFLFLHLTSYGQKFEVSITGGSDLFHYTGNATAANSFIIESHLSADKNYTNNPYGKTYAFGYNTDIRLQYVIKENLIAGVSAGYQAVTSKVNINQVQPALFEPTTIYTGPYNAEGSVSIHSYFISLSPYIGYRLSFKKLSIDVLPGTDIAFIQYIRENGQAFSTYGRAYNVNYSLNKTTPLDVRLKIGLAVNYYQFSLNGSYAHGITNYDKDLIGVSNFNDYKVYSELFSLSLGYRIY